MDNIDDDATDTSRSNRSKSGRGSDDDDDLASSRSGSHAGNGSAGRSDGPNGRRKSSVISMNLFNSKGQRESTPKNYEKAIHNKKFPTPKGNNNPLSQPGGDDSNTDQDDFFSQKITLMSTNSKARK